MVKTVSGREMTVLRSARETAVTGTETEIAIGSEERGAAGEEVWGCPRRWA